MLFKQLSNVLAYPDELKPSLKTSSANEIALSLFSLCFMFIYLQLYLMLVIQ